MRFTLAWLTAEMGAVAAMVWLAPATVHIAAWSAAGPSRIAYLAPLSRLYLSAALAAAVLGVLIVLWRGLRRDLDSLPRALAPLLLLWLWVVPFLPWLPDHAPLLLLLAGPLKWIVAAMAAAGVLAGSIRASLAKVARAFPLRRSMVFAISFAVYATLGQRSVGEVGFGGDEPHYLIITQSLMADGDLDIANNHEHRDYRSFFSGELRPDFLRRGVHGEIYSIHAPGLPAVLLPAYVAGGGRGATLFMAFLSALASLAVFDLAGSLASPTSAVITWVATCFSVPFIPHAWLIYPELPCALIVAWAALWLYRPPVSWLATVWHGAVLAFLPWLHTKFIVFTGAFLFFELIRRRPRLKQSTALIIPIAVSCGLWLWSFYVMYGEVNPEAPYGTHTQLFVLSSNIPRGVLGLLFDQKFGLLVFSPIYGLAAVGIWILAHDSENRFYAFELASIAVAYMLSSARYYMWWGGSSPPARFLVPIVPLLAPLVAAAVARATGIVARTAVASAFVLTVAIAIVAVTGDSGRYLYSDPHGVSALVKAVQSGSPLDAALPTFTEEDWPAPIAVLLPWMAALLVTVTVLLVCGWRKWLQSRFWSATFGGVLLFFTAALIVGSRPAPNRQAVIVRGRLSLMHEYDPSRLRAVDVSRLKRLPAPEVMAATALSLQGPPRRDSANPGLLAGPFDLPEGSYEARIWFAGEHAPSADLVAGLTSEVTLARTRVSPGNPSTLTFGLPVRAPTFVGITDAAAARGVSGIDIQPLGIVPNSARAFGPSRGIEVIGGTAHGFMAYVDDHTYPENGVFWTRETQTGTVAIVTAGASTLRLVLHVGPAGGGVALAVDGHTTELDLRPNETRELPFALNPGTQRVSLSVKAGRAFRPADVDPQSSDRRLLGCQVRPLLD